MSSSFLLNICLKVIGVYYALSALNMLPSSIMQILLTWDAWSDAAGKDPFGLMINYKIAFLMSLLLPILLFLFASLIVFKSEYIANVLLRKEGSSDNVPLDAPTPTALNFAIKIFGFFSVLSSIPYVSELLSKCWIMRDNLQLLDTRGKIELASSSVSVVLYVSVGVVLVFYSSIVANRLMKLDSTITSKAAETETTIESGG
jgi:hypothetical protein